MCWFAVDSCWPSSWLTQGFRDFSQILGKHLLSSISVHAKSRLDSADNTAGSCSSRCVMITQAILAFAVLDG